MKILALSTPIPNAIVATMQSILSAQNWTWISFRSLGVRAPWYGIAPTLKPALGRVLYTFVFFNLCKFLFLITVTTPIKKPPFDLYLILFLKTLLSRSLNAIKIYQLIHILYYKKTIKNKFSKNNCSLRSINVVS